MNCIKCKDKELAPPNKKGTVYLRCSECDRPLNAVPEKRTVQQNKRFHQYMREMAEELNNRGLYMQVVLKPTYDIEWTEETVKDHIFRPLSKAIAGTEHTSELTKEQFQKVIDTVDKNLLQKFQVNLPFSDDV